MLVNHTDAVPERVLRGTDHDLLPVYKDLSVVGEVNARDHVHQRGLSAAVLTEDRKNLPVFNGQRDIVVRHDCPEALGDMLQPDCRNLI